MSLSVWLDGGKFSEIDRANKALMAAAILPLVACMPVRLNILLSGCGGAILAFAIAIRDKFFFGCRRAFWRCDANSERQYCHVTGIVWTSVVCCGRRKEGEAGFRAHGRNLCRHGRQLSQVPVVAG